MKSFLKPLFLLVVALGLSSTSIAQNKQITIKKEVDEHGNIISYDSTVIETSGNIDPEQLEEFQREMEEMSAQFKDQMADFRLEMESSMESMREQMDQLIPEDFNMEKFSEMFNMDNMQKMMEEQMKMFDQLFDSNQFFDSKESPTPSQMKNEQMY